ncbi:MAG: hypothetical protein JXQ73_21085, partial [Phycisphaerae bacterium]|nr:hypothetical protein [Phycisphaerae bacterium]
MRSSSLRWLCATLVVVAVGATSRQSPGETKSASKPSDARLAVEARDWDAVFARTNGWTGADADYSVDLGDGRTLWLYGDTWIGSVAGDRHAPGSHLVNNTIAVHATPASGSGLPPRADEIAFYWGPETPNGKPTAWIVPDP